MKRLQKKDFVLNSKHLVLPLFMRTLEAVKKPTKADEFQAWCETLKGGLIDGRDKSIKQDSSCVVVARYGRIMSRMSTFGNSATAYWPSGEDLITFTRDRDDGLARFGAPK